MAIDGTKRIELNVRESGERVKGLLRPLLVLGQKCTIQPVIKGGFGLRRKIDALKTERYETTRPL